MLRYVKICCRSYVASVRVGFLLGFKKLKKTQRRQEEKCRIDITKSFIPREGRQRALELQSLFCLLASLEFPSCRRGGRSTHIVFSYRLGKQLKVEEEGNVRFWFSRSGQVRKKENVMEKF